MVGNGAQTLRFRWLESGKGIDPRPQRRRFGRDLIGRGLPYDFSGAVGSLSFGKDRVQCTIKLPVNQYAKVTLSARGRQRTAPLRVTVMRADGRGHVLNGRGVLVVEDQYLIAEDLRRVVITFGGEVVGPVGQVSAASELVRRDPPDLALVDINLQGETLYPVAEQLREQKVPMIFATGYDSPHVAPDFAESLRLEKPVSTESLAAAARSLGIAHDL